MNSFYAKLLLAFSARKNKLFSFKKLACFLLKNQLVKITLCLLFAFVARTLNAKIFSHNNHKSLGSGWTGSLLFLSAQPSSPFPVYSFVCKYLLRRCPVLDHSDQSRRWTCDPSKSPNWGLWKYCPGERGSISVGETVWYPLRCRYLDPATWEETFLNSGGWGPHPGKPSFVERPLPCCLLCCVSWTAKVPKC